MFNHHIWSNLNIQLMPRSEILTNANLNKLQFQDYKDRYLEFAIWSNKQRFVIYNEMET